MTARLRVAAAGPLVCVQDGGRPGYLRFGVPRSGPMDRLAFRAANRALGNPEGHAGLEISPGGLVLDCLTGGFGFALAGGGFRLGIGPIGAEPKAMEPGWWRGELRAGERLTIRPGRWGNWCYLALAGDLDVPRWLGSAATHSQSGFGGGLLTAGREIELRAPRTATPARLPVPLGARPTGLLRLVLGPQEDCFSAETLHRLTAETFRLTPAFDRMGMRLAGPELLPVTRLDLPSGPVARGAVQVAGDGVATVLMADHQTTGGYPRIATLLDAELDSFAQMRPHHALRFKALSPAEATGYGRMRRQAMTRYLSGLDRL